jgi:hypothetical protein
MTTSLGIPDRLERLMHAAGWDTPYVLAVEVGGRGVFHPDLGWVSTEELLIAAAERNVE